MKQITNEAHFEALVIVPNLEVLLWGIEHQQHALTRIAFSDILMIIVHCDRAVAANAAPEAVLVIVL